jgi:inhibitor of KinA sporulation pathway (predicted exonuclease)
MARQLDQILIIDLESTCWEGEPPAGQTNQIIEIGLCTLDVASGDRLEKRSILVKPTSSTVSEFCTRLTTLTPEQVNGGVALKEACAILKREYAAKDRVWASYGDYDRRQFERQCQNEGISYPFGPSHLNVKTVFALARALPHEIGMDAALQMCKLPLEGTHHRAGDDAWNIAAILSGLLKTLRIPPQT